MLIHYDDGLSYSLRGFHQYERFLADTRIEPTTGDVFGLGRLGCEAVTNISPCNCINSGEFGLVMRFDVGEDVTGSIPSLAFISNTGAATTKSVADGVSIATADFTVGAVTFMGGQHLIYILEEGFIDSSGNWSWRAEIETDDKHLNTDFTLLKVRQ